MMLLEILWEFPFPLYGYLFSPFPFLTMVTGQEDSSFFPFVGTLRVELFGLDPFASITRGLDY